MRAFRPLHDLLLFLGLASFVFGAAALLSAAQTQAQSQSQVQVQPVKTDSDITRTELRNFDQYLDSHPEVAEALRKNPKLINNMKWVNQHPQLKDWLEDHPNARKELKENPQAFMRRERGFEERGGDITRTELRNFDQYLDNHPEVAEALRKNPGLVNDSEWVNQHPHLKDWLEDHPNARRELKEHPRAFMHREGGFEKHEEDHRPVKRH